MSDNEQRPILPPPLESMPPDQQRSGCVTALIGLLGVILLLPGLCALIFSTGLLLRFDSRVLPFVLVGFVVGVFGVLMIRAAIRRSSRR